MSRLLTLRTTCPISSFISSSHIRSWSGLLLGDSIFADDPSRLFKLFLEDYRKPLRTRSLSLESLTLKLHLHFRLLQDDVYLAGQPLDNFTGHFRRAKDGGPR